MKTGRVWAVILLSVWAALYITGCSGDKAGTEITARAEIPVTEASVEKKGLEAFVELGAYRGLSVEGPEYTVKEEEIHAEIMRELEKTAPEIADGTVENGDIVNIDYKGSIEGKSFQGGENQDYDLKIGSGSFVQGFEDQLLGCGNGQEKNVSVTFPEDYSPEGMRGKKAEFTVKINSIKRPLKAAADDWAKEYCGYDTVEEYEGSIRARLEEEKEKSGQAQLEAQLWEEVLQNCRIVQYPKDMLESWMELERTVYQQYADTLDMTFEEVLDSCKITEEDFTEIAKIDVDYVLISAAICEKEGIDPANSMYQQKQEEILESLGYVNQEEAVTDGATAQRITATVQKACAAQIMLDACSKVDK